MKRSPLRPISRFTRSIPRDWISTGVAALLLSQVGCAVVGTWRRVTVVPERADFPIRQVTFDEDHAFTALVDEPDGTKTVTGTYTWNGRKLELSTDEGVHYSYRAHKARGRRLIVVQRKEPQDIKATLAHVQP